MVFFAKSAQVLALLAFLIRVEARLLELVVRDGVLHTVDDELDALLDFGNLLGQRSLAQLHARSGFIDQVDRLVRQEAVRNITVRVRYREVDGVVGVSDGMKLLVPVFDPEQNLGGVGFVRRRNLYRLEAALQRTIFFDRLAILARSGGADALDLTARQRRLQDVGRIERAFRRTCAYQGMQFVDEDDGVLRLHQLLHDGLQALFELAAILGARHDQRKVESENALVRQKRRDFAVRDALRQPFDDGGLAHAGLADQHRIVLGAAAQNLDDALQFAIASHQRIELVVHGGLGQVAGKLTEQGRFALPLGLRFLLAAARQFLANGRKPQTALVQNFSRKALLFSQ